METKEPIIRLIVDNTEKKIGPSIGISEKRSDEIFDEVVEVYKKHDQISASFKEATETYYHPAELVWALFCLGQIRTQDKCPLHGGGRGIIGLMLGGIKPPDGDGD